MPPILRQERKPHVADSRSHPGVVCLGLLTQRVAFISSFVRQTCPLVRHGIRGRDHNRKSDGCLQPFAALLVVPLRVSASPQFCDGGERQNHPLTVTSSAYRAACRGPACPPALRCPMYLWARGEIVGYALAGGAVRTCCR